MFCYSGNWHLQYWLRFTVFFFFFRFLGWALLPLNVSFLISRQVKGKKTSNKNKVRNKIKRSNSFVSTVSSEHLSLESQSSIFYDSASFIQFQFIVSHKCFWIQKFIIHRRCHFWPVCVCLCRDVRRVWIMTFTRKFRNAIALLTQLTFCLQMETIEKICQRLTIEHQLISIQSVAGSLTFHNGFSRSGRVTSQFLCYFPCLFFNFSIISFSSDHIRPDPAPYAVNFVFILISIVTSTLKFERRTKLFVFISLSQFSNPNKTTKKNKKQETRHWTLNGEQCPVLSSILQSSLLCLIPSFSFCFQRIFSWWIFFFSIACLARFVKYCIWRLSVNVSYAVWLW